MIDFGMMVEGLYVLVNINTFLYIILGILAGLVVGALPGLTTTLGMALFLPFTFFMEPMEGLPFLIGIYRGGTFGGSIPAILINTPGTAASAATVFDGYPMSQQGKGGKALNLALYSSVIGDSCSSLFTIFFIGLVAKWAMLIGRPEFVMIILFAFAMIGGVSGDSIKKGIISATFGLFLSTIGTDAIMGSRRFIFGLSDLSGGLNVVVALLGLFGLSEIIIQAENRLNMNTGIAKVSLKGKENRVTRKDFIFCAPSIAVGSLIGALIGIIPGIGQPVASFLGYGASKRISKHPENFGKGALDGLAGCESADSAVNGTTLIPMLTLGVPGDVITSVLIGAFIAQGIRPSPTIFAEHGGLIYGLLYTMIVANILLLITAKLTIPYFAKLTSIARHLLFPCILVVILGGTFAIQNNPFDVLVMGIFGMIGYAMRKTGIPLAPMVIALILGRPLEVSFIQSLLILKSPIDIFTRPFSVVMIVITVVLIWGYMHLEKKANSVNMSFADDEE